MRVRAIVLPSMIIGLLLVDKLRSENSVADGYKGIVLAFSSLNDSASMM